MVKISVIVPIYNTEKYLSACLDSILQQMVQDIEVLAVNNGCTDGCADILKIYAQKDSRVKVINREHGEVADARNTALRLASGEYLCFCDSDDTVPPNAYFDLLNKAEHGNLDVVVGNHYNINDKQECSLVPLPPAVNKSDFQLFLCTPCVWNKLIRRSFLEKEALMFPNLIMGEDVIFLTQLLKCKPQTGYIRKPVYYYWHHTEVSNPSMTHRYSLDFFKLHLLCRQRLLSELKDTQYQQEALEYVYLGMIYFLRSFLFHIWDGEERKAAFQLFKEHLLEFDWHGYEAQFAGILGIDWQKFQNITAEEYMVQAIDLEHREVVLQEYKAGMIGFRYILKYVGAWFGFKLKHWGKR